MKHLILIAFIFPLVVLGQNKTDKKGLKQGVWEVKYDNSSVIRYKGSFKNNKPFGEFVYYYENGKVKAISNFEANGDVSRTKMYDMEGNYIAFGKYVNQQKDSTWTYFSNENIIAGREDWRKGQRHGKKITYYANGNVYEEIPFVDGLENGRWTMFYSDGKTKVTCMYLDGNLDGKIIYYHANGKIEAEGQFKNAVQHGFWRFYDSNGRLEKEAYYKNGELLLEGDDIKEELDKLKQEGKL
jgi:antitoxin component YwqK of YwqJK toxin-antitoxin module